MTDGEGSGAVGAGDGLDRSGKEGPATGQGSVYLQGRSRASSQPGRGGRGARVDAATPRGPADLEPRMCVSGRRKWGEDVISRRASCQGTQLPDGSGRPPRRSRSVLGEAFV